MKRAIDEWVGEISEGGTRNVLVNESQGKYRHCLLSEEVGFFFFCYTDKKVKKAGEFV